MNTRIKKIRDNITKSEFKYLLNYLQADSDIKDIRRYRLTKMFNLLYLLGVRVNELSQLTNNKMIELINNGQVKIVAHKQKKEKKIYITKSGKKVLKSLFQNLEANNNFLFISARGSKRTPLEPNSFIRDINDYLKKVFPNKNITSHSFRASLVSELINDHNISVKVVQQLVGHSDISTTYLYAKVTEQNIMNTLNIVR